MEDIYDSLKWLESVSVRFRPKSMDVYEKVLDFSQKFEQLPASERAELMAKISSDLAKKLLSFSAFFAELAMASGESKWIRGAGLLHVLEDFRADYRENYRYLVLVAYSSKCIKADFVGLMHDILHVASAKAKGHINDFLSRDNDLNELEKFGIRVSILDNQPRFVQL